jgi:signal transduction histidine kinase
MLSASLLLGALPLAAAIAPGKTELTTAAEVRALSLEEAREALRVRLRGVVMGEADPEGIAFVIQDETEGIYVQGPAAMVYDLTRGDLLEIEGVSDPGGFAPYVVAHSIRKVGRGQVPDPISVTLDELNAGQMDAKWVEISGIVRTFEPKAPRDSAPPPPGTRFPLPSQGESSPRKPQVKMKLASGTARVVVQVSGDLSPEDYVDAEVRLRGLCFNLHNHNRQFVRPFVQMPSGVEMSVVQPPQSQPFDDEPRPLARLLQFDQLSGKLGHRVHVRGTVVHHRPGAVLWIRDLERSLRIETTQREVLQPGDEVDVVGFPASGEYSAILEDALFRKRSSHPPPSAYSLTDVASALQHDADLVELEARLTEVRRFPDSVALTLDWRQASVPAQMHLPRNARVPAEWVAGAVVRVAGVCSVITDQGGPLGGLWEPSSFQLLLRSPADLVIIRPPPWWNAQRIVWVLSGFLVLALAAVAAVMFASRRHFKEQEHRRAMAEAEFTAILAERNRMAREIHDTLSQSLGAISVQLELARTHAGEISAPARNHLGSAHKLARDALAEARESIWNMRSHVLETCDLGEALEGILRRMTEDTGASAHMHVEGTRRRLPPIVENNLLRIGQEAITNASRHARPARIDVTLTFEPRTVRLAVKDDGVGFLAGSPRDGDRRSFGLVGMQERAKLLGGTVEIRSAPGEGTDVLMVVPV